MDHDITPYDQWIMTLRLRIRHYEGHYALQRTLHLTKDIMPNPVSLDKRFVNTSSTSRLSATGRIV